MARRYVHTLAAMAWLVLAAFPVGAEGAESQCFDVEVSASIVRQTPTLIPECDGCIVMRWPWILDLHVRRVHGGPPTRGDIAVINLQHSHYRPGLGPRRWFLRRNRLGGFNVVNPPEKGALPRCSPGDAPAEPLIRPADGRTIDDLRREGEARYGPSM